MFVTGDNSEFVRINFSTDIEMSERVNERAIELGMPPISNVFTMGGYCYPILEELAQGRHFQILKSSIPENAPDDDKLLRKVLLSTDTVYSYVDTATITIIQIEGWDSKVNKIEDYGFEVISGQKTFKRLKTVNRPWRIWSMPDRKLRVAIVEDTDYTTDEFEELDPELQERLLDGAIVISRELYEEALENISFPISDQNKEIDEFRQKIFKAKARKFKSHNARIFGEFEFSGIAADDPIHTKKGMLKAQAFINTSDICERMGVDIIAARSALKHEVSYSKTFIGLEPQSAKFHANGDVQSIGNNPALFDPTLIRKWISNLMVTAFEGLKKDELFERWYNMDSPSFSNNEKKYDQSDLIELTKWNARCWVMSGMSLKDSPWLFEQMAKNLLSIIQTKEASRMRIPIPCAVRVQVVSQSLSSMAGTDIEVDQGQIRWDPEHEVLVVNDNDWIEMYESHGGMDLDDFFVGYWRTIDDEKKVIIMRSPNDYGEYSVFDYVQGDWFPTETLYGGKELSFPKAISDPDLWPKRLSEAVRDGDVIYTGLPSSFHEEQESAPTRYSLRDVSKAVVNNVGSQSCVGANVNSRSLHSISVRKHRPYQLAPMEACIDTGAQGGHADDIEAVIQEAYDILDDIIRDDSIKVDAYMWNTRFLELKGMPFSESRLTHDTHISKIHNFRMAFAQEFMKGIRKYVEEYVGKQANSDIQVLGRRKYNEGILLVKEARYSLVAIQEIDQNGLNDNVWNSVHDYVISRILKEENEIDRHDLVLGMYLACLKMPTRTTQRISDQLMMNPAIFPYTMAALRYYHIAYDLDVNEEGNIVRIQHEPWVINCLECDMNVETTNPRVWQMYNAQGRVCSKCKEKVHV